MAEIPPEIIELFLSHLNFTNHRNANLKKSCLVSRTWRSLAQPLLFSDISVDTEAESSHYFADLIVQSPHLISYVNFFCISGKINEHHPPVIDVARIVANKNPRALEIRWTMPGDHARGGLDPELLAILPDLLSSTRLTSIHLQGIDAFPITLFQHCLFLRDLTIKFCTFIQINQPDPEVAVGTPLIGQPKPKLQNLTLTGSRLWVDEMRVLVWLLQPDCAFDLSELKVFKNVSKSFDTSELVSQFIQTIGSSLEIISVDTLYIYIHPASTLSPLAIEKLHNLRSLTISLFLGISLRPVLLSYVIDLLSNLPQPILLTELVLDCLFNSQGSQGSRAQEQGWEDLDRLLVQPTFANLRDLVIICDNEKDEASYESLELDLLSKLPLCLGDPRKKVSIHRRTTLHFVGF